MSEREMAPSATLRAAAERMRQPWFDLRMPDLPNPPMPFHLALAKWLDWEADVLDDDPSDYCGDGFNCASWYCGTVEHALALARIWLGADR